MLSCFVIAAFTVLAASGCEDDSFLDSGSDYNARSTSKHLAGARQFWVPLRQPSLKTKSPELLAPTESAADKVPIIADPDALAAGDTGLVEKMPDPMAKIDTEDQLAGSFKYTKAYREPLLPPTGGGDSKGLRDLRADSLSLDSGGGRAPVGSRGTGGPAGPLGDLKRRRELRARHAAGQSDAKDESAGQPSDDDISAGLMHPDPVPEPTGPQ